MKLDTCETSIDEVIDLTESDSDSDDSQFAGSYDEDSNDQFSQFF